jgi:hypothetical protein
MKVQKGNVQILGLETHMTQSKSSIGQWGNGEKTTKEERKKEKIERKTKKKINKERKKERREEIKRERREERNKEGKK